MVGRVIKCGHDQQITDLKNDQNLTCALSLYMRTRLLQLLNFLRCINFSKHEFLFIETTFGISIS